ncbi:uncharacterized protein V6R79_025049 [Siganus canaliculatus]
MEEEQRARNDGVSLRFTPAHKHRMCKHCGFPPHVAEWAFIGVFVRILPRPAVRCGPLSSSSSHSAERQAKALQPTSPLTRGIRQTAVLTKCNPVNTEKCFWFSFRDFRTSLSVSLLFLVTGPDIEPNETMLLTCDRQHFGVDGFVPYIYVNLLIRFANVIKRNEAPLNVGNGRSRHSRSPSYQLSTASSSVKDNSSSVV